MDSRRLQPSVRTAMVPIVLALVTDRSEPTERLLRAALDDALGPEAELAVRTHGALLRARDLERPPRVGGVILVAPAAGVEALVRRWDVPCLACPDDADLLEVARDWSSAWAWEIATAPARLRTRHALSAPLRRACLQAWELGDPALRRAAALAVGTVPERVVPALLDDAVFCRLGADAFVLATMLGVWDPVRRRIVAPVAAAPLLTLIELGALETAARAEGWTDVTRALALSLGIDCKVRTGVARARERQRAGETAIIAYRDAPLQTPGGWIELVDRADVASGD